MNTFWDRVAHFYDDALRSLRWTDKQAAIAEGVSGRVLEACCGMGSLALTLRQRGVDVYALDLAPRMLARAAAQFAQAGLSPARLVQGDVTRLPFPDRAFDYVLATGALGLLPRPTLKTALGELTRVGRRALTWCVDGMHPLPRALLEGLAYQEEWRILGGIFSYIRVML